MLQRINGVMIMQKPAFYRVLIGLPGCMPNSNAVYQWDNRRSMAQGINSILDDYGFTQRNRRQVNLVDMWRYIQSGGKKGHFVIRGNCGNPCNAEFQQITESEFETESEYEDS
jgi:hypothetical protein